MTKKLSVFIGVLMLLITVANSYSQPSPEEAAILEQIWKDEIINPSKLITAQQFFDGKYCPTFWYKIDEILSNAPLSAKYNALEQQNKGISKSIFRIINDLPEENSQFVCARHIGWFPTFRAKHLATGLDQQNAVTGESQQYKIVIGEHSINNNYFTLIENKRLTTIAEASLITAATMGGKLESVQGKLHLQIVFYYPSQNQIFIESRVKLPPGLWLVLLHRFTREAHNDIVVFKNQPPEGRQLLSTINALGMGIFTWKFFSKELMGRWNTDLDKDPTCLTTKIVLLDLLIQSEIFAEYLKGDTTLLTEFIKTE
ncbi:MAG TPA: hypothetical protein DDX47_02575 [Candidatus Jacksonbacteria bacterium]|nr:hypothetical protein [Candidatus Jacksonbacteria bacterium]HCC49664.1 hypothetical protein [Candidatus Jacksonbacteria bacterium]HCE49320.1 hypothetical protein [Candidatus Jacksonbacteria bacterium]